MGHLKKVSPFFVSAFVLLYSGLFNAKPLQAQSITVAPDGTGTIISTPDGKTYTIEGGSLSGDGANLFHSFEKFGLNPNEVANFLSNPQIRNILGRVVGGDPSVIQGLIQVTGGTSNLFLMNPAGIIFGRDARLNIPASFTATTANGIGFDGGFFNAVGENNYAALVGSPNRFAFTGNSVGSLTNSGDLVVAPGQDLTFMGGKFINTGTLKAPGGNITIVAVPEQNLVRLSQPGMILSLEIETTQGMNPDSLPPGEGISALDLPQLLTGRGDVGVNVNPDGTVKLVHSNTLIGNDAGIFLAAGNVDTHSIADGGTVTLNAIAGNIITDNILTSSQNNGSGGNINVSAGGMIDTTDSVLLSVGMAGEGGDISLAAGEDIQANDSVIVSAGDGSGDLNLSANGEVAAGTVLSYAQGNGDSGDINVNAGEGIDIEEAVSHAQGGDAGDVNLNANGDIYADSLVSASGSPTEGITPEIGTPSGESSNTPVNSDSSDTNDPEDILTEVTTNSGNPGNPHPLGQATGGNSGNIVANSTQGSLHFGAAGTISKSGVSGQVNLNARVEINGGTIRSDGGKTGNDIVVAAGQDINTGDITSTGRTGSGDIHLNSFDGNINTGSLHTDTGAIYVNGSLLNTTGGDLAISPLLTNSNATVTELEESREKEFEKYFGKDLNAKSVSADSIRQTLADIEQQTGDRSAVIYVNLPHDTSANLQTGQLVGEVKLVVILPEGEPINITVPGVERSQLLTTINDFRSKIATSYRRGNTSYLPASQQLYQWLIAPLEPQLKARSINTLLFAMDSGLRTLPIAALHDGKQFLVEKYSLGMVPSFGLINPAYKTLENAQALAMGATTFQDLDPLPAVSAELSLIHQMWSGLMFLNQDFNRFNLVEARQGQRYSIVHLATHAEFNPGSIDNSYIQLWNEKLPLSQMPQLRWKQAAVELLTLSACRTAVDSDEAAMGFAGLTVATGVKSALASLWSVSDEGTFALMTEFYHQLQSAKVKSEALRQAQLAMIQGRLKIEDGQLKGSGVQGVVSLPPELTTTTKANLSHPYYWSSFTMIGNPW